jgi:AcrB/AcrD/AcrF family
VLDREAQKITGVLSRISGAADVRVQSPGGLPQMNVQLIPSKLVQFGFRPVDVLDAIQTAYQGSAVAQIYDGSRLFDVSVILQSADRRRPEEIKNLLLRNAVGEIMPLGELASSALQRDVALSFTMALAADRWSPATFRIGTSLRLLPRRSAKSVRKSLQLLCIWSSAERPRRALNRSLRS